VRYLIALLALTFVARGETPPAREILQRVRSAYTSAHALHIVMERQESASKHGRSGSNFSTYELAVRGSDLTFARVIRERDDSLVVSDGSTTWKALVSRRQWSRTSSTLLSADDSEGAPPPIERPDLYAKVLKMTVGLYIGLARGADEAAVVKEESLKLSGAKVPCYVVRARSGAGSHELWIDKQRFLVLQHRHWGTTSAGLVEAIARAKLIEWENEVKPGLFQFQPAAGWQQVHNLILPGEQVLALVGQKVGNFSLKTLEGDAVTLHGLRGQVVVLDFWATWCPPCRAEFPAIERLYHEFGDTIRIYGLSNEDAGTIRGFLASNRYRLPILQDVERQVGRNYGIFGIPSLVIIDRTGVVRYHFTGDQRESTLRKAIRSVVEAPAAAQPNRANP
jgi:peroxiredoxin